MGENENTMGEKNEIEDDLANLARLAAQQSHEDVRLLLARMIRKYRTSRPELAAKIDNSLKLTQTRSAPSVIRRAGPPNEALPLEGGALPLDAESKLPLIRIFDDTVGLEPPLLSEELAHKIRTLIRERK